jgi:lysophospholipase L1-like esterase
MMQVGISLGITGNRRAGGGLSMPIPPLLEFYPADKSLTRNIIPRYKSSVALPSNILRYIKGANFAPLNMNGNGATITLAFANGPEGNPTAARCVSTNTTGIVQISAVSLPAGTFTLSFSAKTNDASTVDVQSGDSGNLATITVTPSWQTFSRTFTLGSPSTRQLYPLYRNAGSAYDILIDNIRLDYGGSALGADTFDGHLTLGKADATASASASFNEAAVAQFASAQNITDFTVISVLTQTGTTGGTPVPFISSRAFGTINFAAQNDGLAARVNGTFIGSNYAPVQNAGSLVVALRAKSGQQEILVDGQVVGTGAATMTSQAVSELYALCNGSSGASTFSGGSVGPIAFFDSFLTEDQIYTASRVIYTKAAASGLTMADIPYGYVAAGDSITLESGQPGVGGTGSYARRLFVAKGNLFGCIRAVSSTGISTVKTNLELLYPHFRNAAKAGKSTIVSLLIGANDAQIGTDPSGYITTLTDLCTAIKATGAKVLYITTLPKAEPGFATFNTGRITINDYMRSNSQFWDGFADLDATAIGLNAAPAARVYYYDDVHLNGAGYDIATPVVTTAFDAIVAAL